MITSASHVIEYTLGIQFSGHVFPQELLFSLKTLPRSSGILSIEEKIQLLEMIAWTKTWSYNLGQIVLENA